MEETKLPRTAPVREHGLRLVLHKQDHPSTLPYVTPLGARNGPVHLCGTLRDKDAALQGGNDHKAVCCAFAAEETIFSS